MDINGQTSLIGIVGHPLTYTISPQMHNAAAEALGLNLCYVPLVVEAGDLEAAVNGLKALNFKGVNVTMPHKETIIPLLDGLDDGVRAIGAVNTVRIEAGKATGYNTDARGFITALGEAGFDAAGTKAVVVGAGGAARAAVLALAEAGAEISILNRTPERSRALAGEMKERFPNFRIKILEFGAELADKFVDAKLIVNATPVGMKDSKDETPIPTALLDSGQFVFDLIYEPDETLLMREASARGAVAIGGLSMLIHQAAASFEIWTGVQPPIDLMRAAAVKALRPGR
ncbi:MAG: shikimate dehydrogenase [Candidatus Aquicultorales bacterium]